MTLLFRYPDERQKVASIEFARRWVLFARGKAPWKPYTQEKQSICIGDSQIGWTDYKRKEDEELSPQSEGGERRYRAWEEVAKDLKGLDSKTRLEAVAGTSLVGLASITLESMN